MSVWLIGKSQTAQGLPLQVKSRQTKGVLADLSQTCPDDPAERVGPPDH